MTARSVWRSRGKSIAYRVTMAAWRKRRRKYRWRSSSIGISGSVSIIESMTWHQQRKAHQRQAMARGIACAFSCASARHQRRRAHRHRQRSHKQLSCWHQHLSGSGGIEYRREHAAACYAVRQTNAWHHQHAHRAYGARKRRYDAASLLFARHNVASAPTHRRSRGALLCGRSSLNRAYRRARLTTSTRCWRGGML